MPSSLITDFMGSGPAASRPTTPDIATGQTAFWYATDTKVLSIWKQPAAAWENLPTSGGGGGGHPWWWNPPLAASLSHAFGTAPTVFADDTDVGLTMQIPASNAGTIAQCKTTPAGVDWTVTAHFDFSCVMTGYPNAGLVAGNGTQFYCWTMDGRTAQSMHAFNNSTSGFDGWEVVNTQVYGNGWRRMHYDHTADVLHFAYSPDGKQFIDYTTVGSVSSYCGVPAYVGVGMNTGSYGGATAMSVGHWDQSW